MQLVSSAFQNGGAIPRQFTCEGDNVSPELSWKDAPKETRSFVLILHDPDAPKKNGFTHWVVYNIPPDAGHFDQGVPNNAFVPGVGSQAKNDSGRIGYMGPCPPSGKHRYFARLYALKKELPLSPGAEYHEVASAMGDLVIEQAELLGTYTRGATRAA